MEGNETRLNYLQARKQIYAKEYIRLIQKLPEYGILLEKLRQGKNILICEMDVPANGKRDNYGLDCDENNNCLMSIEKLKILLNDTTEAFGHGLCLAYSLLMDLQNIEVVL